MKRLSLLAVSMLLTCTLFAADIFLRGTVNGWGASDDFKFATSDNVVYTLEKSFDLSGEFKFAGADWTVGPDYGSDGTAVATETPLNLKAAGGNFKCGTGKSYEVTKIVLNLSDMTAIIYGKGGELEITSRTVVGEDTDIFGNAWDPENTANDMVKEGNVWIITKENISLSSDVTNGYEYKIVANHKWGIDDFPEKGNDSFSVSESGVYDVKFEYDETTNTGKAYATKKSEPTTFDSYILVGDAALFVFDWTPSPMGTDMFTLETTDGIHYTKTVNGVPLNVTGTFAYGFSKNGSTTDILFKDKSKTVTIVEAATYNITVALTVAPGEEPLAEAVLTKVTPGTTYYIAGNGDAETDWCCGESWNPAGCAMESGYFTRDLPAGEYKFKITQGDWEKQSWGYDAVDAAQSTAGYTPDADGNVVFTLETLSAVAVKFDGSKIALQWTAKDEPVPPVPTGITVNVTVPENTPACYFYGEMSGNNFAAMTKVDDTHYTVNFAEATSIGWGYLFCWESGNFSTKNTGGDFKDEPVDGVINVEVVGWVTEPGTEYHYTTYTQWEVNSCWNGEAWAWISLEKESEGVFSKSGLLWGETGMNIASGENPIKKDWYPIGDADLNVQEGLKTGDEVKVTLKVVDDETVAITVTGTSTPVVFDTWSLIGDMPPFPKSWTILPGFDLQTEDGVIYTLTAEDVDMTVDKFEYGFRKNNTDEYAPLAEKYTANLTEGTGNYKVEIALDFTDAADPKVEVQFTKIPEPVVTGITVNVTVPDGTPACFFYGEMSGNTFVEMTKVDDTHYTTKFEDKESIGWGYLFCWESGNFSTQNTGGDFKDEPVDGVINVEVVGWVTEPGTEYKYTTYTDWKVKSDWNGDWDTAEWLTLTNVSDGVFEGEAAWGTGPGVNLGSESGPVKKDWYPAGDPALTIEEGLAVGQAVKITLTVVDDENVTINVADANPTSADEAVEDAIYANNGTVYCNAPFEIYNLVGQNVTSQNGTLNGVFIVKTANMVKTVLVK